MKIRVVSGRIGIFVLILLLGIVCLAFAEDMGSSEDVDSATLDTGYVINAKMKSLANGTEATYQDKDTMIRAIRTAETLPEGFEPSEKNIISTAVFPFPVYIFFDNTDDAGIMYVYTEADRIAAGSVLSGAFCNMESLYDISGIVDWDVSRATEMVWTFCGTASLTDISALEKWDTGNVMYFVSTFCESGIVDATPISQWNTSSAVAMMYMFQGAGFLRIADVSGWDTGKLVNMNSMFCVGEDYKGNGQLREIIGLGNLDVSNVWDMTCMFYGAGNMTHYDISGWDVSNVVSFNHMFCDNFRLEELDLSGWDTGNVRTMCDMFDDCYALTTIGDVSRWNTASLIDAGGWLNGAGSFTGENGVLDLSGWNTGNLKATGEMFRGIKVHTIDLSGWDFSSMTNEAWEGTGDGIYYETGNTSKYKGMAGMFMDASELEAVYVSTAGLESYLEAVERGVTVTDMWKGTYGGLRVKSLD